MNKFEKLIGITLTEVGKDANLIDQLQMGYLTMLEELTLASMQKEYDKKPLIMQEYPDVVILKGILDKKASLGESCREDEILEQFSDKDYMIALFMDLELENMAHNMIARGKDFSYKNPSEKQIKLLKESGSEYIPSSIGSASFLIDKLMSNKKTTDDQYQLFTRYAIITGVFGTPKFAEYRTRALENSGECSKVIKELKELSNVTQNMMKATDKQKELIIKLSLMLGKFSLTKKGDIPAKNQKHLDELTFDRAKAEIEKLNAENNELPATEKQLAYIEKLYIRLDRASEYKEDITKAQASEVISELEKALLMRISLVHHEFALSETEIAVMDKKEVKKYLKLWNETKNANNDEKAQESALNKVACGMATTRDENKAIRPTKDQVKNCVSDNESAERIYNILNGEA